MVREGFAELGWAPGRPKAVEFPDGSGIAPGGRRLSKTETERIRMPLLWSCRVVDHRLDASCLC